MSISNAPDPHLRSVNSNQWIDKLDDFVENCNFSNPSSIKKIPERLEIFDKVDIIRDSFAHNDRLDSSSIMRGDFVRLLNKRGAFEKEGQRFTCRYYLLVSLLAAGNQFCLW
jgi:hypothetical protein